MFQTILVVQGAEYKAVCRGLRRANPLPTVIPIPIGIAPVKQFLTAQSQQNRFNDQSQILVLGLCGSLQPSYRIGDIVLYESVMNFNGNEFKTFKCNLQSLNNLYSRIQFQPAIVNAWTSKQFIQSVRIKQQLSQTHKVNVVDMEGTAILEALSATGAAVTMLRVVSDDCHHELPDLSRAISPTGALLPLPLMQQMMQHPIGTLRLVQGAMIGLKVLQQTTAKLFISGGRCRNDGI